MKQKCSKQDLLINGSISKALIGLPFHYWEAVLSNCYTMLWT